MTQGATGDPLAARRIERRIPRYADLKPLLRMQPWQWNAVERSLASAEDVKALRRLARRRVPRSVFDYTDGGAGDERALRRSRAAFDAIQFRPHTLRDVSATDPSTSVLGGPSALPIGIGPTGFTRLMNHEGEVAVARSAHRHGIPYSLSTMGTSSVEAVAAAAPDARKWFQLYLWRDREASKSLVDRAAAAGFETLILTVDTPVGGARLRDVRNGLTIPPTLTVKTVLDVARKPRWWIDFLTTDPLEFASMSSWAGTIEQLADKMFDPMLNMDDFLWLRDTWKGKIAVKGVVRGDDAKTLVDNGADAIIISNHGGRQLDRAITPLDALPDVKQSVGDRADVIIDGGILSGGDAVAALCLGADYVLIGRAYLYGLMAGGERGVDRALDLLRKETVNTMQLVGARNVGELRSDMVVRGS